MQGGEATEVEEHGAEGGDARGTGESIEERRGGWRATAVELATATARSIAAGVAGVWGRMRGKRYRGEGEREEEERKRRRTGDG